MTSTERRIQDGSRALSLAFNLSRAEEALFRVADGSEIAADDRIYFSRIADLFADARIAFSSLNASLQGSPSPVRSETLRALQLVLPVVQASADEPAAALIARLETVSRELSEGKRPDAKTRQGFVSVLQKLASHAAGEGMDALQAVPPVGSFGVSRELR
jgi:hypothetical protein